MSELIIQIMMAYEATQPKAFWLAYLSACGGGIIRSFALGQWSGNLSIETICSIFYWFKLSQAIVHNQQFIPILRKLNHLKPYISIINTIAFGYYGLNVAPSLGWFSYYITACGGGLLSFTLQNNDLSSIIKYAFRNTIPTFIEGVLLSIIPEESGRIITCLILITIKLAYRTFNGRAFLSCIQVALHIRHPTNIGKTIMAIQIKRILINTHHCIIKKKPLKVCGCLCRRQVILAY